MEKREAAENQHEKPPSSRLRWIDQGRGFIMLVLILTIFFPPPSWISQGSITFWLFTHASATATYMTLYDAGAAIFIFVMGLSFSIAFQRRRVKESTIRAVRHVLLRYALILVFGLLILGAFGPLIYESQVLVVLAWDVLQGVL